MAGARNYLIVTASYWSFTLTDGALRMLVLLHFYSLGYTPFMLASLFLLYEAAGIFANLGGGWLAARFGIPRMLAVGLVAADRRAAAAVRPRPGLGRDVVRRLGRDGAGHLGRRQGHHQDRLQIGDQGDLRGRRRAAVPLGRVVHRLEERDEGFRLLRRRASCSKPSASARHCG